MSSDIQAAIEKLEDHGTRLSKLLRYASRAFVIEFAGTPKSGKSTSVEAVRHFFSRLGFRVHVLSERASVCPIPMKGHLFFNTWCATSMLAELLANIEAETDIIIVDRGLFDALVWFSLQKRRGELTLAEAEAIESFILLDRWRNLIDLVVAMNVTAEEALSRENSQRITRKSGSIMNLDVLNAISGTVSEAIKEYDFKFNGILNHSTTGQGVRESNILLVERILKRLEEFLNPQILVVPKRDIETLALENGGAFGPKAVKEAIRCISGNGYFLNRDEAESRKDLVQIIPCGLLTYNGEVFLFQRKENDRKYRLYGKATIWQGCHVPKLKEGSLEEIIKNSLLDRVSRSLFLSRVFPIKSLGYCWNKNDSSSRRHLGVVYRIDIDNIHTAIDLKKKEFRKQRGHGLFGRFEKWQNLVKNGKKLDLESWSRTILNGVEKL